MRLSTPSRAGARTCRPSTCLAALTLLLAMAAPQAVAVPAEDDGPAATRIERGTDRAQAPKMSTPDLDLRPLNPVVAVAAAASLLTLGVAALLAWQGHGQGRRLNDLNVTYKAISRRLDQVGELKSELTRGLNDLGSQFTPAAMVQIEDLLRRVLREQASRGPDPAHAAVIDHQRKDLAKRESELKDRVRASEVERQRQKAEVDEDRRRLNQERAACDQEKSSLECDRAEHERRVQDHQTEREGWDREKDRVRRIGEQMLAEAADAEARAEAALREVGQRELEANATQAAAASDRRKAEDERRAAAVDRQKAEDARKAASEERIKIEAIREYFWPPIFRADGALADWRGRLEEKGRRADSSAPLLINSLHRYTLLHTAGDRTDGEEIARSLQEIGRQAYQFWAEEMVDPEQQAGLAEEWARAFESELGPPYKVRIVRPGQPKDNTWMTYKYGGSSQVARVESWCVQGPSSTLRASVH